MMGVVAGEVVSVDEAEEKREDDGELLEGGDEERESRGELVLMSILAEIWLGVGGFAEFRLLIFPEGCLSTFTSPRSTQAEPVSLYPQSPNPLPSPNLPHSRNLIPTTLTTSHTNPHPHDTRGNHNDGNILHSSPFCKTPFIVFLSRPASPSLQAVSARTSPVACRVKEGAEKKTKVRE